MMAPGHVHSSSLVLRLASYHLAVFSGCPVDMMTPLAWRDTPAPAAAPARRHLTLDRSRTPIGEEWGGRPGYVTLMSMSGVGSG